MHTKTKTTTEAWKQEKIMASVWKKEEQQNLHMVEVQAT